jgi:F-type H+-transporting ATPase subunit a
VKKRYWIFLLLGLGIVGAILVPPVQPPIFVPGERLFRIAGDFYLTNTMVATLLTDIVLLAIAFFVVKRPNRTVDDIPSGFYNVFEVFIEGIYNMAEGTAGRWARKIFPWMMTIILMVLVANWMELIPGVDSIGLIEPAHEGVAGAPAVQVAGNAICTVAKPGSWLAGLPACELPAEAEEEHPPEGAPAEGTPSVPSSEPTHAPGASAPEGAPDASAPMALSGRAAGAEPAGAEPAGTEPAQAEQAEAGGAVIVPFVRAAATDLNFTLALALVAMAMTEVFGLQALGPNYLKKFFNFDIDRIKRNPMAALDPAVGILELISELARVISFTFRLFGNIFAGQVLLFVLTSLVPVLVPLGVGLLELFVGAIQAFVFGLLTLAFMSQAVTAHHGDEHGEEHPAETPHAGEAHA